jgi:hypothetical protein
MSNKHNHGWTKERWLAYESWYRAYWARLNWHRAALDIFDHNATD